jgi:signal transduction histidine kinase
VIGGLKAAIRRRWPPIPLRAILFSVLLFAAAMPGFGAISLRVYENTLVRQTESELTAQSAALAAAASVLWPGSAPAAPLPSGPGRYRPEPPIVDLSSTPVLAERPPARRAATLPDPDALGAARALEPIFEQTDRTTLASIILVDRNGVVVRGREAGGSYAGLPEVRAALAGRRDTELRRNDAYSPRYAMEWVSRASYLRLHHARPVVVNGRVVGALLLSRSPRALFRGIYQDRGKIALGIGVIFAILVFLAGLVSRGVTRPIEALSRASRDVAAGRGEIPETPQTAALEIQALYEDFRAMARTIARRSRYLKDLAAAVSHEFKTPLAGIKGAAELLEDHHGGMSEAERRKFLGNITADTARLSQLVTRLLDLARADMAAPEQGTAVDLEGPVRRVADASRGEGFDITVELPDDLPPVTAAAATIETVLTTLVENSRQAGAGRVRIAAEATDQSVTLSVTDDGPGVPVADRERLFEPFFTSRRSEGGTGLGLPIARSLLTAGGGELRLGHSDSGARFELVAPVAKSD